MYPGMAATFQAAEAGVEKSAGKEWILYDGECDFCRRIVTWVGKQDRNGTFTIVPFQDAQHSAVTPEVRKACERSVHVIRRDGRVLRGGEACLYVGHRLGWRWAKPVARSPLIRPVEGAYRIVADNRQIFSKFFFTREIE